MVGLSIFRSHFQIMCWKGLLAASAHLLLKPVWQPSCSFRWQNMFSLVHFGTCGTDTPKLLTSFVNVLWYYSTVWFKIKQVNPKGLYLLIFFFSFSERERHDDLLNMPRNHSKSLPHCEHRNGSSSESYCPNVGGCKASSVRKYTDCPYSFVHLFVCVYLGICRIKAPFVAVGSVLLPYMFWKLS